MTFFLSSLSLLLLSCCAALYLGGRELERRATRDRLLVRGFRQKRRSDARTIRTLEQYLAAYVGEVERLRAEARPAARYVGADGEMIH
jgi:hypothetical protein